ncbi:MAG: cohesin domain-containing protein, partial [Candidatus Uhrbacteria bacterium]
MKKLLTFLVTFGLVFGTYGIASAAGSATLDFSPDTKSVATGETFNLDVMIDPNGESLDTVRVVVSYPASMLEVTSYSLGSVFDTASPGNSINNATGSLSQGAFKTGGGVTSSGKVGTITFRALSAGTASIAFGTTSRAISAGVEKLSITGSGSASVSITGDAVAGEATSTTVLTTEQIAIGDFGAITGYSPSSDMDWLAISYMVNGYSGERDLAQEQAALARYVSVFGATPSTSYQWNVIAAIAYSGAILDWDGAAEAVVEAPVAVEVPVAEASLEQQALVYFGAFYGFMPSTSNDWDALHCFAYGGCQGDPQDVDA